jgi:predicted metal-dependent hydrolase
MSQKQIQAFLEKHQDWIEKHELTKQNSSLETQKIPQYKKLAKQTIPPRVEELALKYGFSYKSIKITSAMTRWGSCTSKKNLNFTYRLVLAPPEVLDYVIVHELCHLRHMNHSRNFWNEVALILPNYKNRSKWLKEHGKTIS